MNYQKDVSIDESGLDTEWLAQPGLMMKYSRISAQLHMDMDVAKENVDLVRAELDGKIRSNPAGFGIDPDIKVTEAVISGAILQQEVYKEAMTDFYQARYEWEMAKGAVSAIEHRKAALENLVRLHGLQYFAGPSVPRDLTKEWEQREVQKNADNMVATRMKRRT